MNGVKKGGEENDVKKERREDRKGSRKNMWKKGDVAGRKDSRKKGDE